MIDTDNVEVLFQINDGSTLLESSNPLPVTEPIVAAPIVAPTIITETIEPVVEQLEVQVFVDNSGNIVNEKGVVILPKDKIQRDAEGNILNLPEHQEEPNLLQNLANKYKDTLGVNFNDEQGQPLNFTNDEEGIAKFVNTVSKEIVNKQTEEFFQQFPAIESLYQHLSEGKNPEDFTFKDNYYYLDNAYDATDQSNAAYIYESFIAKGHSPAEASEYTDLIVDSGKASVKGKEAFEAMKNYQASLKQNKENQIKLAKINQEKEALATLNSVKTIIDKGEIGGGFKIPDSSKPAFFKYITEPVDAHGHTQAELDSQKEDLSQQLAFDFMRFNKFDLSKFVDSMVKDKRVQDIKSKIKYTEIPFGSAPVQNGKLDVSGITIDRLQK